MRDKLLWELKKTELAENEKRAEAFEAAILGGEINTAVEIEAEMDYRPKAFKRLRETICLYYGK